jgi:hypothetical protein
MMKTVTAMLVALLVVTVSEAQTTSDNLVGYSKVTATGGQLSLVAVNFETGGLTVNDIFGDLPNLSTVYVWDKAANTYVSSTKGRAGFSPNPALANGDAMWVLASGSSVHEIIVAGEVNTAAQTTNTVEGLDAIGYGYPVAVGFEDTSLSSQAPNLSTLNVWNGSGYNTYTKGRAGWGASAVTIGVSDGFWINSPSSFEWVEDRPFTF